MFRSLQSRLFFSYLLITALLMISMLLGVVVLLRNNPIADQVTYRRLELGLPFISRRERGLISGMDPGELEAVGQRLDQVLGARVFLLNQHGEIIVSQAVISSLTGELQGWTFEPLPPAEIKHKSTPVLIYLAKDRQELPS